MDQMPTKSDITSLLLKILPPFILSVMAKIASDYKRGKNIGWISSIVVVCLAGCGAILGYWVTVYLGWREIRMTLTIFAFGLFADKLFEYLFSKTFINDMFNYMEEVFKENLHMIFKRIKKD